MDSEHVSMAGEYAVASEICKRGHDAHLTYGNKKEMDILVYDDRCFVKVEVKSKVGGKWPWIKGIPGDANHILIFVDFQDKKSNVRPDFYVLTGSDWKNLVPNLDDIKNNENYKGFDLKDGHTPTWVDGNRGIGIRSSEIEEFKEQWDKLDVLLMKMNNQEKF